MIVHGKKKTFMATPVARRPMSSMAPFSHRSGGWLIGTTLFLIAVTTAYCYQANDQDDLLNKYARGDSPQPPARSQPGASQGFERAQGAVQAAVGSLWGKVDQFRSHHHLKSGTRPATEVVVSATESEPESQPVPWTREQAAAIQREARAVDAHVREQRRAGQGNGSRGVVQAATDTMKQDAASAGQALQNVVDHGNAVAKETSRHAHETATQFQHDWHQTQQGWTDRVKDSIESVKEVVSDTADDANATLRQWRQSMADHAYDGTNDLMEDAVNEVTSPHDEAKAWRERMSATLSHHHERSWQPDRPDEFASHAFHETGPWGQQGWERVEHAGKAVDDSWQSAKDKVREGVDQVSDWFHRHRVRPMPLHPQYGADADRRPALRVVQEATA